MDIIEALDLDLEGFGKYFYSITNEQIEEYSLAISKSRKELRRKRQK